MHLNDSGVFVVVAIGEVALCVVELGNDSELVVPIVQSSVAAVGVAPKAGE